MRMWDALDYTSETSAPGHPGNRTAKPAKPTPSVLSGSSQNGVLQARSQTARRVPFITSSHRSVLFRNSLFLARR